VKFDFVGGWASLAHKDFGIYLLAARDVLVVMDGGLGGDFSKEDRPLTDLAKAEQKSLETVGVQLKVLWRYGIENYVSRAALEAVLGEDLSLYFPLPETVAVSNHLVRPDTKEPFYRKSDNAKAARRLDLERDLSLPICTRSFTK